MRLLFVAMLIVLAAGVSSARTPLVRAGGSNDAWERPRNRSGDCSAIPSEQVFAIETRRVPSAVRWLRHTSLRALSDREVGDLLNVDRDGQYPELARQLLSNRIAELSERRRLAYHERRGGWSVVDEENLGRIRQRFDGFREHPLTFYLVRALAADATRVEGIDAYVCGQTVLTRSLATTGVGSSGRPDRQGIVVLLDVRPERSVAEWSYRDPSL
ncbi:MAG: hypothetical protein ABUL42_03825 [Terricaulis silvestris]